ncbi:sugar-binding protein [Streptomyces sp. CA-111067]|uniref:sugar-binding protein n=1 Tax=Streptomyces sp. CA-111067 TaxID=3240046 RepID=UPI003D9841F7
MATSAATTASPAATTTYYVDSAAGSDANNGTSQSTPWKSLDKVNATTFQPGSQVLFKAGGSWTGTLKPLGSGSSAAPNTIGRYGTGGTPAINAAGAAEAVLLHNVQYWTVTGLQLTNQTTAAGAHSGVVIDAQNAGLLHSIHINGLDIHDIDGLSASATKNSNAAILVTVESTQTTACNVASSVPSWFDDLRLENNYLHDLHTEGVYINGAYDQWCGAQGSTADTTYWYTNLVVRNNFINRTGADGVVVSYGKSPLVENNTLYDAGINGNGYQYIAGLWSFASSDSLFQYNEVARMHYQNQSTTDSGAFDTDLLTFGTHVFQYNYTHDNAGGILLDCSDRYATTVYRYNISQNDSDHSWSGGTAVLFNPTHFYNNTIVDTTSDPFNVYINTSRSTASQPFTPDMVTFQNNVVSTVNTANTWAGATYDHNAYQGGAAPAGDTHAVVGDPQFTEPGMGSEGRGTVDGYQLKPTSPLIGKGVAISGNGGKDYWGDTVPSGSAPDIGADQYTQKTVTVPAETVHPAATAPTIDGVLNSSEWSTAQSQLLQKATIGLPTGDGVKYSLLWDSGHLYVGFYATDNSHAQYPDDSFDIYFDPDNSKSTKLGTDDRFYNLTQAGVLTETHGNTAGVTAAVSHSQTQWFGEIAIPWSTLGVTPAAARTLGFDIAYNDDMDGVGGRSGQLIWAGNANDWRDPEFYGNATLSAS